MNTKSKWLGWKPETQILKKTVGYEPTKLTKPTPILADLAGGELTKPKKPSSVSFVASPLGIFQKIEVGSYGGVNQSETATAVACKAGIASKVLPDPSPEELALASAALAKAGVRLMRLGGVDMVGIWSDLDGPEVRAALHTFGSDQLPVRYLDGDGIPMKFKLRRLPGEPVPANVLSEREKHPVEPWKVRDRMLAEMGGSPDGIPWAEWKARSLNNLFLEQGVTGQPGKIRPETVRRSESRGAR